MGVFPLADTMIRFSVPPRARGNTSADSNGWTNEVWWYPHPTTTPRRDAAAAHSPNSLTLSDPMMRCSGTGRDTGPSRAGRTSRRAPAGSELAAGNGLQ